MSEESYDVAVIGAGVNGAGIARDAALRGLKVIVVEQNDLCSGTSAASSRLIHGGLRYLEFGEIPLVFESLRERITLRKIAEHLVKPVRITIPIYSSGKRGKWLIRLGMIAYDLLSVGKTVARHDMLSRDATLAAEPGVAAEGLLGAARYFDAQITFAERLVLENLLAARSAGAEILTYSKVTQIDVNEGEINWLECVDVHTQQVRRINTNFVINAAGPWVDSVLSTAVDDSRPLVGGTKGSHIIVSEFEGAPRDAFYVEATSDGRPFFIIPWNDQYLIGTTDIRFEEDLSEIRASTAEVEYLLEETNRVFPAAKLGIDDINFAYAGVRPLPKRDKGPESSITRRHIIHVDRNVASGLISIIGGKLTTYRNLAEQAVQRLARVMARKLPECRTRETLLPGAYRLEEARTALQSVASLSEAGVARLLSIYGGRAIGLLETAGGDDALLNSIDKHQTVLAIEVVHALREEMARTLVDIVHRRMMLGLSANQGRDMYAEIAAVAAKESAWDESRRSAELSALTAYSDSFRL